MSTASRIARTLLLVAALTGAGVVTSAARPGFQCNEHNDSCQDSTGVDCYADPFECYCSDDSPKQCMPLPMSRDDGSVPLW
jgi:hypothetical protein